MSKTPPLIAFLKADCKTVPIPATRDFKVLKDGSGRPMLLSIGNDGILYLVASDGEGQSGTHRVRNLTEALGLDKSNVSLTCFDAVQSVSTGAIYIALAAESGTNFHQLILLRPFDPATVDVFTMKFTDLIIPQKVNINPVKKIYMVFTFLPRALAFINYGSTGQSGYRRKFVPSNGHLLRACRQIEVPGDCRSSTGCQLGVVGFADKPEAG